MSELIERVAQGIAEADGCGSGSCYKHMHTYYLKLARAAVRATREPTGLMLKASCAAMSEGKRPTPDRVSSKEKHRIRYRAMIDAELSRQTFGEATLVTNGWRD